MDVSVSRRAESGDADARRRVVHEHVAKLTAVGGSVVVEKDENGERWVVMRDPEGNEFACSDRAELRGWEVRRCQESWWEPSRADRTVIENGRR